MSRFRFAGWRIIIAVTILAVTLTLASRIRQRRIEYLRAIRAHTTRSKHYLVEAIKAKRDGFNAPPDVARSMEARAERMGRLADAEDRLIVKYQEAARSPWLPVAPDPPEPK